MKNVLKRILTICVVCSLLLSVNLTGVSADEPVITYSIEYTATSATVTFYATLIDAFDLGIVYDPSLLSVTDCSYTTEFKKLQADGNNTTISVKNEDAKDESGNTYVVFTGAGVNMDTGEAIDFSGKPIAYVRFEGDLKSAHIKIVSDTAAESNVNEANLIGELMLDGGENTVVTPEPIDNVVYVTPEPKSSGVNDSQTTQNDETVSQENDADTDTSNDYSELEGNNAATEEAANETEGAETETPEISVTEDNKTKDSVSKSNTKEKSKSGISPFAVAAIIIVIVAIAVAVIIIIKKKKKS